ncbi:hypothetical protein F4678DRAFT_458877 [Xylaria arbuscula]|nr:hypothetical protein F4678DRAFT_458877 [Xylaria arbuscula]
MVVFEPALITAVVPAATLRAVHFGYDIAKELQKLLKNSSTTLDKPMTLANRMHILTVMREALVTTLKSHGTLEDSKVLIKRKWLKEMQDLVTKATWQSIFLWFEDAFDHIDSTA